MELQFSEEYVWANGLASRLRLIQANFADDSSAVRQGYITEEIERALKTVPPASRKVFLEALVDRFPAWDGMRSDASSDDTAGLVPLTAEELVARLVQIAPSLSPEARQAVAAQLQAVELVTREAPHSLVDLPVELRKKLGLAAGQKLDIDRAAKLLSVTVDLAVTLDQLAWALWRQLAPKSTIRKESEFNRLAGPYLAGDPDVSTAEVMQPVERTRRLISALVGAIGRAGAAYAKKHAETISPEVLEEWAKTEKKWNESLEAACWRRFLQMATEHWSEAAIEHEMQEAIAKTAEVLFAGRNAG